VLSDVKAFFHATIKTEAIDLTINKYNI